MRKDSFTIFHFSFVICHFPIGKQKQWQIMANDK